MLLADGACISGLPSRSPGFIFSSASLPCTLTLALLLSPTHPPLVLLLLSLLLLLLLPANLAVSQDERKKQESTFQIAQQPPSLPANQCTTAPASQYSPSCVRPPSLAASESPPTAHHDARPSAPDPDIIGCWSPACRQTIDRQRGGTHQLFARHRLPAAFYHCNGDWPSRLPPTDDVFSRSVLAAPLAPSDPPLLLFAPLRAPYPASSITAASQSFSSRCACLLARSKSPQPPVS